MPLKYILFSIITILFSSCAQKENVELFKFKGSTMGTTYSIKVAGVSGNIKKEILGEGIDSILVDVNNKMSTYINSSELMNFNNNNDTNWIQVSKDLVNVFAEAEKVSKLSNGMFDITIGALVNLWGFGPFGKKKEIPSDAEITSLLDNIGYDKIIVDTINNKIKKKNPEVFCDLSSIAKGFGVDKVAEFFNSSGINNYMIEIGGEVRTKGVNENNLIWKIGIATPNNNGLQKIVKLSGYSIATSGDYLNYFEKNGVRYSHTINPKTGKPITHKLASVSVIHKQCSYADAFATAIEVLGPEKGFKFGLQHNLPIFMIIRENNNFVEKITPQFKKFLEEGN